MLAHRRADVRDLNEAARALMREAGQLGERALVAGDREFRPGDRVVCRRNDPDLGVRNGTRPRCATSSPSSASSRCRSTPGRAASSPSATPPSTSSTATRSPATPPKARRSIGRSSSCAPRVPWPNGATSRPPGPGPRRASMRWGRRSRLSEERRHDPPFNLLARGRPLAKRGRAHGRGAGGGPTSSSLQPEIERLQIQLDSRAEQLRATESELSRLGWFGRGPRHGELREAISVQRHAVRELQTELRALAPDDARVRPASPERAWSRAHEQPVRQAPSRGMTLGL